MNMYSHGGHRERFAKRYGFELNEIFDFSSNINPLGPPARAKEIYEKSFEELSWYPEPHAESFSQMIAQHFSTTRDQVIVGNGSLAVLNLAIRALRPKMVLIAEPSFSEYRRIVQVEGAGVREIDLNPNENFEISLSRILEGLPGVDLMILGHPNSPTGTALSREALRGLLHEAKRQKVFTILDEAFVDWVPEISAVSQVRDDRPLLVVRSMTKFYALAGIRIGFGIGPKGIIEKMKNLQGPWTCNRTAQRLGQASLVDRAFEEKSRLFMNEEKMWLKSALEEIQDVRVFPSLANFFLVQVPPDAQELCDFLGGQGICIRDAANYRGLDSSYIRLAVRSRDENKRLVLSLQEFYHARACSRA